MLSGSVKTLRQAALRGALIRVKYDITVFTPSEIELDPNSDHISASYADKMNYQTSNYNVAFKSDNMVWLFITVSSRGRVDVSRWNLDGTPYSGGTHSNFASSVTWYASY